MSQMARFRRMFEHAAWANTTVLAALQDGPAPDKACAWLAHLVGAERLWLARLQHEPATMPVWPDLDLAACGQEFPALATAWQEYLETLDDEALEDGIGYRNSKGEFWTSTVGDILTHVSHHGAYHRGQIASAVRAEGGEPAYTDFIHAARQGLVG